MIKELSRAITDLALQIGQCRHIPSRPPEEVWDNIDAYFPCPEMGRVHVACLHRDLAFAIAKSKDLASPQASRLESAILSLSSQIGEIPRDTLYTYSGRASRINPATFSGSDAEQFFVMGLQGSVDAFMSCLSVILDAWMYDYSDTLVADELLNHLVAARGSVSVVAKHVKPEDFVNLIEPHFVRREVGGVMYYGPTASQLPLCVVEACIYGRQVGSVEDRHLLFQLPYLPPPLRCVVESIGPNLTPLNERIGANYLQLISRELLLFRRIHFAMARRAFALQSSPSPFALALLENLLMVTERRAGHGK